MFYTLLHGCNFFMPSTHYSYKNYISQMKNPYHQHSASLNKTSNTRVDISSLPEKPRKKCTEGTKQQHTHRLQEGTIGYQSGEMVEGRCGGSEKGI